MTDGPWWGLHKECNNITESAHLECMSVTQVQAVTVGVGQE